MLWNNLSCFLLSSEDQLCGQLYYRFVLYLVKCIAFFFRIDRWKHCPASIFLNSQSFSGKMPMSLNIKKEQLFYQKAFLIFLCVHWSGIQWPCNQSNKLLLIFVLNITKLWLSISVLKSGGLFKSIYIYIYQAKAMELVFLKVCSNPNRENLLQLDCARYMGAQQFCHDLCHGMIA